MAKNPNQKNLFFFLRGVGGGGGGWGCGGGGGGGGSKHNVEMFQIAFCSSRNTNVPNCSEIHA